MQIKRFEAPTMAEALKLVKREFGPEAVILSARTLRAEGGLLSALRRPLVEVTAATDRREAEAASSVPAPAPEKQPERPGAMGLAAARNAYRQAASTPVRRPAPAASGAREAARRDEAGAGNLAPRLRMLLKRQGLGEEHIAALLPANASIERAAADDACPEVAALAGLLSQRQLVELSRIGRAGTRRALALVGTAGVGKTSLLVKLAARFQRQQNGRIALLGLDTRRIGAAEQLQSFARILGVPCQVAGTTAELALALERLGAADLLLVDTPGLAPQQGEALAALGNMLSRIADLEIWLLASATTRGADLALARSAFGALPLKRLVVTHLDETRQPARMLGHALQSALPIACVSTGPQIPGDIAAAEARAMARLILGDLPDRIRQGGQAPPKGRDTHQAGHAEAAAPAASALPEAGQVAEFVAHVNSNLFHCADCIWIRSAAPQHLIVLASPAEAQRQNYKPCRTCTPDQRQASAKARLQPERQLARQGR